MNTNQIALLNQIVLSITIIILCAGSLHREGYNIYPIIIIVLQVIVLFLHFFNWIQLKFRVNERASNKCKNKDT